MRARRNATTAAPLFTAAAVTYVANCALGAAVAARIVDTSGFRWLHHALYVTTCACAAAAVITGWSGSPRRESRTAAVWLMPAAVPLMAVAFAGTHGRRHPLVALAAAPFIASGLARSLRPAERK